jgi:RimJ/RimL family protein N-acetyltransferase
MALVLRPTTAADLDFVLAAEADEDAAPFILGASEQQHRDSLSDPDQAHLIVVDGDTPAGFVLLAGLTDVHGGVELRRIVVAAKGRGTGRAALALVLDHAFGTLGAHRVWLDVMAHNERARHAYAAVGFVEEGVLRDALLTGSGHVSLVVMSMLRSEWRPPRAQVGE